MTKIVFWGICPDTFNWLPSTLVVDLDVDFVETYDGTKLVKYPTSLYIEKTCGQYLALLEGVKPMKDEDHWKPVLEAVRAIAVAYPGIILYGLERFPNETYEFSETFWEKIGHVNIKSMQASEKALDASKQLEALRASKAVPEPIKRLATAYNGRSVVDIPPKVRARLKAHYPISEETFTI